MGEWCAANLRDCKAWQDEGTDLSTTSNEAAKLCDSLVRQYVSWINCDQLGGIDGTIKTLTESDPDAIMGKIVILALDAIGTGRSTSLDDTYANQLEQLLKESQTRGTIYEKMHAKAVHLFANDQLISACNEWEKILESHPTDLLALKLAHDAYFYLGDKYSIRDSVARVFPQWKTSYPCYSYLHGMYAFGLEECGQYRKAEVEARKGLEIQPKDAWSSHALAHVFEMTGDYERGITFMESTVKDWEPCFMLACHNFWHVAVYYIEKGNYESALSYFDREIDKRVKSGALLDIVDAASILLRLEIHCVDVEDRWQRLLDIIKPHMHDHLLAFNDAHIRMVLNKCGNTKLIDEHRQSMANFVANGSGDNCNITRLYGEKICDAVTAFSINDYDTVVENLYPIRNEVFKIGGSNAQWTTEKKSTQLVPAMEPAEHKGGI